jgi:hypothetical protein
MGRPPLKITLNTPQTYQINLSDTPVHTIGLGTPVAYGAARLSIDTTANWAEKSTYIPRKGEIIVYSDWQIVDNIPIPGIKIGDGISVVGILPFANEVTYSILPDKPQINGVTLTGNLFLADLFSDGIIIDGGEASDIHGAAEGEGSDGHD